MQKIIIHEKYNVVTEGNDIALLKITPPVVCGSFIGPGCLPHFKAGPPKIPQTCYVSGWGYMKEKGEYRWGAPWWALVPMLCAAFSWQGSCIDVWLSCLSSPRGSMTGAYHRPLS